MVGDVLNRWWIYNLSRFTTLHDDNTSEQLGINLLIVYTLYRERRVMGHYIIYHLRVFELQSGKTMGVSMSLFCLLTVTSGVYFLPQNSESYNQYNITIIRFTK